MNKLFTSLVVGAVALTTISSAAPAFAKDGGREKENRGRSSVKIQENNSRNNRRLTVNLDMGFSLHDGDERLRIRVPRGTTVANSDAFIAAIKQAHANYLASIRTARQTFQEAVKKAKADFLNNTTTPNNTAPTVASAAVANPSPVNGSTTVLSVLGADNNGEGNLTYTWTTVSKPSTAANPTFSVNGTNAAKTTVATFNTTGSYQFMVTITDAGLLSTTSNVSVNVTVPTSNSGPTVATAAAASPSTVTGSTTTLTVLGADDGGENSLNYTWTTVSKPASASNPTFSVNGTNAAKTTVATFTATGTYQFQVTITDSNSAAVTSLVSVVVNPTVTNVTISPSVASLGASTTLQFSASAFDQFNAAQASAFTWSIFEGILGGSISSTGLYTASSTAGVYHVIGASNFDLNKKATSTVTVTP